MYRNNLYTPSHFKDLARNAIYLQLPQKTDSNLIRLAPSHLLPQLLYRLSNSSIFSSAKRSVRSAPSIYSLSTATIPEDSEAISITVEQLVNDITLHESYFKLQEQCDEEVAKISLGLDLQYQNQEMFIDWNLNVTRCKLILTHLPMVTQTPDFQYTNSLPQLVGDLSKRCHIVLILPTITDTELIYTWYTSNIYQEHGLEEQFLKNVAEVLVKQSRLLQINNAPSFNNNNQALRTKYKGIAIRNYLINLAAAALTLHEYKVKLDECKKEAKARGTKFSKEDKKVLWEEVRGDVFHRAGLSG